MPKTNKKPIIDIIYSIGALLLMNGVIQLIIYPVVQGQLGSDQFGVILSLLSVISILATTFGSSAHYSRLLIQDSKENLEANSDYNLFFLLITPIIGIVCFISLQQIDSSQMFLLPFFILLSMFTIYRSYADVNYRINLDFKGYFRYYLIISCGYIIGCLIWKITKNWFLIFLMGEIASIVSVLLCKSSMVRLGIHRTPNFNSHIKSILTLALSNFILALILNIDRIILLEFVNAEAVTNFYIASLIGKMMSMITTPLNGVILSYVTRKENEFSEKTGRLITFTVIILGTIATIGSVLVSHLYVYIVYPALYTTIKPYFLLANLGQILYFLSSTIMVFLLKIIAEKYQFIINLIYLILYLCIVPISTYCAGLNGLLVSIVIVNGLKLLIISFLLLLLLRRKQSETKEFI